MICIPPARVIGLAAGYGSNELEHAYANENYYYNEQYANIC